MSKKTDTEIQYGWHFNNCYLRDTDILIQVGSVFTVDPNSLELCVYGLHYSPTILDALQYAPGDVLSYVRASGKIIVGDDKSVAEKRKHLVVVNVKAQLVEFAQLCAERAKEYAACDAANYADATKTAASAANYAANYAAAAAAAAAAHNAAACAAYAAAAAAAAAACDTCDADAYNTAYNAAYTVERNWQRTKLNELILSLPEFAIVKELQHE